MDIRLSNKINWIPKFKSIKLSPKREDNIFNMKGFDYQLRYLDNSKGDIGGNSIVFMLCDPDNPESDIDHLAVKICNSPLDDSTWTYRTRFSREITALNIVRKASKNKFIIEFFEHGNFIINDSKFPFYTMEKCNTNLTRFIQESEIDVSEKIALCHFIIQGFSDLHKLKIYHRDIKSDNFLMKDNICKIGDLGLVDYRDMDSKLIINEKGRKIGAFGWESPEVMNKILTEKIGDNFDCEIDSASDIFQLGKLFWFVLQGNIPIGQIEQEDFLIDDSDLFKLIYRMLEYKKGNGRRPIDIDSLKEIFKPIAEKYSIT